MATESQPYTPGPKAKAKKPKAKKPKAEVTPAAAAAVPPGLPRRIRPREALKLTPAEREALKAAGQSMADEGLRVRRPSAALEHARAVDALERFQAAAKGKAYEKDIIGLDVGLVEDVNDRLGSFGVRVHVSSKPRPHELHASRRIPAYEPVTGVPIRVVASNYQQALAPGQAPFVVGPKGGRGFGSMGLLVNIVHPDVGDTGIAPAFLTCAHVLGSGDPVTALEAGVDVVDSAGQLVGRSLSQYWEYDDDVDAALVLPARPDGLAWGLRNAAMPLNGIAWVSFDDVARGTPIFTTDAATGQIIQGELISVWAPSIPISDGAGGVSRASFPIQIRSVGPEPFARPGDSGAVCYMNGKYVGLIVGVDPNGNAVATQLAAVAQRLSFNA